MHRNNKNTVAGELDEKFGYIEYILSQYKTVLEGLAYKCDKAYEIHKSKSDQMYEISRRNDALIIEDKLSDADVKELEDLEKERKLCEDKLSFLKHAFNDVLESMFDTISNQQSNCNLY